MRFRMFLGVALILVVLISIAGSLVYLQNNSVFNISYGGTNEIAQNVPAVSPGSSPLTSLSPTPTATPSQRLLPDMKIFKPKSVYISVEEGIKKIRFDTGFTNIGKGPLELSGEVNETKGVVEATQLIHTIDGRKEAVKIGEFVFHPTHDHWHVDKYAQFELWEYDEDGYKTKSLASTDKFSFCIWDEYPLDTTLENAPTTRQFPRCPKNIQGNSVGWGDTYPAYLDGQELDISNIPDGSYIVRSTVNANGSIYESNYANNFVEMFVEIRGNSITTDSNPQIKGWWIKKYFWD